MSYHELYVERGSGPAVVFSHGTLMDATMFAPQLDYLAERGYRAIAYNSRVLTDEPGSHTLDDLVEDCRRLLDRIEIDKCVVAGMSVGGCMALPFALKHQDRLNGLILIDVDVAGVYAGRASGLRSVEFDKLDVDGMVPREFAEWAAPYCFGETTYAENKALIDHWVDRWASTVPARAVLYQGKIVDQQGRHHRSPERDQGAGAGSPWRGRRPDSHRTRLADGRCPPPHDSRAHSQSRAYGEPGASDGGKRGDRQFS